VPSLKKFFKKFLKKKGPLVYLFSGKVYSGGEEQGLDKFEARKTLAHDYVSAFIPQEHDFIDQGISDIFIFWSIWRTSIESSSIWKGLYGKTHNHLFFWDDHFLFMGTPGIEDVHPIC
jgi:hypothetical protein